MNRDVIITCAVTGSAEAQDKHPELPKSPDQIAAAAIEAARAGAAVAHIHVRDPETGAASRDPALFEAVAERIRASDTDVVINLTAGMGGDLIAGPPEDPMNWGAGTDMAGAGERMEHVRRVMPEICTLDCGTMNFGEGGYVMMNSVDMLRAMAAEMKALGVKPEVEVFDTGHLWFAKQLVDEGLLARPPLFQLCLGIPYGAPADTTTMKAMVDSLPADAMWAGFGISRMQMPMVAQAVLLGGHVRVGLEDNLYLERGVLATNGQLVEKARTIIEAMGARVLTAAEAREKLGLKKHR